MFYFGTISNQIYMLRAERRWTQSDLAEKLDVTRQTIAAIENNKYIPSLELAFALSYVFEKNINEIFLFEPDEDDEEEGS
ncbi:helix-turn-helix transcriptional regulator [Paenibacillus yanchengensis]|uniref:Helix-turn-helix transcriptional regulator n=1 Tax=Paenibacillus yanchengensis TaxID=2035833 RepID=A0ABW4YHK9_9BACL